MDFSEVIKSRYSCRKFKQQAVEQEKTEQILLAGRLAPTAVNFQPQRILVLNDPDKLKKIKECTRFDFDAPLNFLVCYDKNVSWKRGDGKDFGDIDAAIVATHMMLKATELGLGSTWVGAFNPDKAREAFNVPDNYEIMGFFPMGYPDAAPAPQHEVRADLSETVFYNNF